MTTPSDAGRPARVVFVCWGNICRSPMAERVAQAWFRRDGVDATVTSAGVSDEEEGRPIDGRARAVLTRHGYAADGHVAHEITAGEIRDADLVVAAEPLHIRMLERIRPGADNLRLISDFDPQAAPGTPLPDPWYGGAEGFESTLRAIERAMPGIEDAVAALPRIPARP